MKEDHSCTLILTTKIRICVLCKIEMRIQSFILFLNKYMYCFSTTKEAVRKIKA